MMEFVLLKRCTVKCMIGRRQKAHLNIKRLQQQRLCPLFFHNSGSDHLLEGVVFAFSGWFNVHGGGANLLLLEAGLEQMGHLGFLKIINRDRERRLACGPIRFISRNLDMTAAGNSVMFSLVIIVVALEASACLKESRCKLASAIIWCRNSNRQFEFLPICLSCALSLLKQRWSLSLMIIMICMF